MEFAMSRLERFFGKWSKRKADKDDAVAFWTELMEEIGGIERAARFVIADECWVSANDHDLISLAIPSTEVAIIQLSSDYDVLPEYKEPSAELTIGQRVSRWAAGLPESKSPRLVIVSNYARFCVYDRMWGFREPQVVTSENITESGLAIIPFTHIDVFKEKRGIADIWDNDDVSFKVMRIISSNFNWLKPVCEDDSFNDDFYLDVTGRIVLLRKCSDGNCVKKVSSIAEETAKQVLYQVQIYVRREASGVCATDVSSWDLIVDDTNDTTYKLSGACIGANNGKVDLTEYIRSKLPWKDLVLFG